ncbi:MAG: hypothetical protein U0T84_01340 [Chitinophagales bacterium]
MKKTQLLAGLLLLSVTISSGCKVCSTCSKNGAADVEVCNTNNQNDLTYHNTLATYEGQGYTCKSK